MENRYSLFDNHCHTQFAYCAAGITVDAAVEKAKGMGLDYIAFTEHAGHLYFTPADCWKSIDDPSFMKKSNMSPRISRYLSSIEKHFPYARAGFEVDLDRSGKINLLPEDREKAWIVIGSIHVLFTREESFSRSTQDTESVFMKANEALCMQGIDVLAHPFRFFSRKGLKIPSHLFRPLAEILKSCGVAAELNFHSGNVSDPAFFEACLEEGVRISPGTDSHSMEQVGQLGMHAEFLKQMGVRAEEFSRISFRPGKGKERLK